MTKKDSKGGAYARFETKVYHQMLEINAAFEEQYKITRWTQWDFNEYSGDLVLTTNGVVNVSCKVQFIGSYSKKSSTWMWGWHNDSILDFLKDDAFKILDYAKEHNYQPLMHFGGLCEEEQAWRFAAVSLSIAGGVCIYGAVPHGSGISFLLVKEAHGAPAAVVVEQVKES